MSVALETPVRAPRGGSASRNPVLRRVDHLHSPVAPNVQLEVPTLAQRGCGLLLNPWRNLLLPTRTLRRLMGRTLSPLVAESFLRPGDWRSAEVIYANARPLDWLDQQMLRESPYAQAMRNRLRIVTARLASLIAGYAIDGPVTVAGVGAGPGRHVQTALASSRVEPARVTAHLINLHDDAFDAGRTLTRRLGIDGRVYFHKCEGRQVDQILPEASVQVAKLVGIVEYLSDTELLELLGALRAVMAPGASLVTHGTVDPDGGGRFRARVFNLRPRLRTARQMHSLLSFAGFGPIECVTEPAGIYPILTAIRP